MAGYLSSSFVASSATGPEARSLPAGRWCGSAPFLRVCSRSHRQPADHPQRGAAHTLSPLSDEMSFRFAATDQCAHSGPLQGARGTPVPAEQTERSRGRPCAPVWGMSYRGQTSSAPAATPSVRGAHVTCRSAEGSTRAQTPGSGPCPAGVHETRLAARLIPGGEAVGTTSAKLAAPRTASRHFQ